MGYTYLYFTRLGMLFNVYVDYYESTSTPDALDSVWLDIDRASMGLVISM